MQSLPKFIKRPFDKVHHFIATILTNKLVHDKTSLVELRLMADKHYRAIFHPSYFVLQDEHTEPTKSQWTTLKKRMKRVDPLVFVFKNHGEMPTADDPTGKYYFIDFGFMAPLPDAAPKKRKPFPRSPHLRD